MHERFQLSERSAQKASPISTQKILDMAYADFGEQMFSGALSKPQVEQFVNQRVIGAKLNGLNILSIDFEHNEGPIDPVLRAYITSPKTKIVVPEYFYPEMMRWLDAKTIRLFKKINFWEQFHQDRVDFARRFAEVCREADKRVAVTDLANKPNYLLNRVLLRTMPFFMSYSNALKEVLLGQYKDISPYAIFFIIAWSNVYYYELLASSFYNGYFFFSKEKIGRLEKWIPDFEQARRLFAAKGIRQLTEENGNGSNRDSESQIVLVYPRAHGIRILDNLIHPSRGETIKDRFYKLLGPGLDFSVRQWEYKDTLQRLAESGYRWGENEFMQARISSETEMKPSLANWMLVSERKIGI